MGCREAALFVGSLARCLVGKVGSLARLARWQGWLVGEHGASNQLSSQPLGL